MNHGALWPNLQPAIGKCDAPSNLPFPRFSVSQVQQILLPVVKMFPAACFYSAVSTSDCYPLPSSPFSQINFRGDVTHDR